MRRLTIAAAALVLSVATAYGQDCSVGWTSVMPNRAAVAESLRQQFPDEWEAMNTRGDLAFIKRLAWQLHQEDPRWGLNGKRQTTQLSEDVLAFLNPTVNNGGFPGVEAVDFVMSHGSPAAQVGWLNITCPMDQGGSGGRWFQPEPVGGTPPPPPPDDVEKLKAQIRQLENDIAVLQFGFDNVKAERDRFERELTERTDEVLRLRAENERLLMRRCEATGPGWIRSLFGISCRIVE